MPATVVVDLARLPATAYDNKHPFGLTKKMGQIVGRNVSKALSD